MAPTPEKLAKLDARRRKVVRDNLNDIIESWCDPETGAGYVLARWSRSPDRTPHAHFFKPNVMNRTFADRPVESNHQRIGLKSTVLRLLAEEKARKTAPHDLEVGQILCSTWGVTMQYADFFRIVAIPHPRKVTIAPIPHHYVTGDHAAGSVMPDTEAEPDTSRAETRMVSMETGTARVKAHSSIARVTLWNGKPVAVYSD